MKTKPKNVQDRRSFVKQTLAGGIILGITNPLQSLGWQNMDNGLPYTTLGKTGLKVSRVGIGGWQIGTSDINQKVVNEIIDKALELGINYIDTAPNYGSSEERLGVALQGRRDKMVIATKTEEQTYEGTWDLIKQSLKRLKTDYLDIVFLHSLGNQQRFTDVPLLVGKNGGLKALQEAKEKGVIKGIGVSGHSYPTLFHKLLDTGNVDVLMNAVNFVARHVYNFEDKVWARAHQEDLGLVAMKVLGGANDKGIRIPKTHYKLAIQYALFGTYAHTAVVGMETPQQVEELVNTLKSTSSMTRDEYMQAYKLGVELSADEMWKHPYGAPTT